MKLSTGKAQGLVVEWGWEREGKGMSFGRVGMVGSVGLSRSGRWGRLGNSGSSGFSKAGTCGTVGNSGLGKVGSWGSCRVGTWGRDGISTLGRGGSSNLGKVGSVGRGGNSTLWSSGTVGNVVSRRWRDARTSLQLIRDRVMSSRGNRMDGSWWWAISEMLKDWEFWMRVEVSSENGLHTRVGFGVL